jgi:hypothetical protein
MRVQTTASAKNLISGRPFAAGISPAEKLCDSFLHLACGATASGALPKVLASGRLWTQKRPYDILNLIYCQKDSKRFEKQTAVAADSTILLESFGIAVVTFQ